MQPGAGTLQRHRRIRRIAQRLIQQRGARLRVRILALHAHIPMFRYADERSVKFGTPKKLGAGARRRREKFGPGKFEPARFGMSGYGQQPSEQFLTESSPTGQPLTGPSLTNQALTDGQPSDRK